MNYSISRSVPFEISDISHGFQEAKGLFKVKEESVELEFEVMDSILGFFKSGVQTIQIPLSELDSIAFEKKWFGSKIVLEAFSMKTFEDIPGTEQATCKLKVKRKHREEAQKVVSKARLLLSEFRLNQMDDTE